MCDEGLPEFLALEVGGVGERDSTAFGDDLFSSIRSLYTSKAWVLVYMRGRLGEGVEENICIRYLPPLLNLRYLALEYFLFGGHSKENVVVVGKEERERRVFKDIL